MKLTRIQLRRLIKEVVTDNMVAAAEKKLADEGGAIGQEDLADEMNDAEEGVELSVEKAMDGLKNKISNFFINKDGDAYIHDPEEGE
tara:strand:- start:212 stop:472 length:261 start_codon:yes stop_codon:yes gene_type:complete